MPTPLTDADKVLRNDTGKDIVTQLTAIKTAIENGGGGGDYANKNIAVTFDTETAYNENDYVIYSGNLYRAKNDVSAGTWTGSTDWESVTVGEQLNLKAFTVVCTQAQYNTWSSTTPKSFPLLNAHYIITDAPNLNPTASDIEYSSGVTVKQAIDGKANTSTTYTKSEVDNKFNLTNGTMTATSNVTVARYTLKKFGNMVFISGAIYVLVNHNSGSKLASLSIVPTKMTDLVAVAKPNQTACAWNVDTDGYLYTNDSMVTGQTYYFNGWYI